MSDALQAYLRTALTAELPEDRFCSTAIQADRMAVPMGSGTASQQVCTVLVGDAGLARVRMGARRLRDTRAGRKPHRGSVSCAGEPGLSPQAPRPGSRRAFYSRQRATARIFQLPGTSVGTQPRLWPRTNQEPQIVGVSYKCRTGNSANFLARRTRPAFAADSLYIPRAAIAVAVLAPFSVMSDLQVIAR